MTEKPDSHSQWAEVVFQSIGGIALFFSGALLFVGIILPRYSMRIGPPSYARLMLAVIPLAVLGLGLLLLRKWAAVGFSLLMFYPMSWSVWTACHPTTGNDDWLGFVFGLGFISPAILTVVFWRSAVWHKR